MDGDGSGVSFTPNPRSYTHTQCIQIVVHLCKERTNSSIFPQGKYYNALTLKL